MYIVYAYFRLNEIQIVDVVIYNLHKSCCESLTGFTVAGDLKISLYLSKTLCKIKEF